MNETNEYYKYKKCHKYKNYICDIELLNDSKIIPEIKQFCEKYYTNKCKINKIYDIDSNKEIDYIDDIYYKNAILEKIRKINLYDVYIEMPNIEFNLI